MNADRLIAELDNPSHYFVCMIAVSSSYHETLHIACIL